MSKDIDLLVPILRQAWAELKPWYENKFPNRVLKIGCTQRTPVEQLRLFIQGRLPENPGKKVTWKDGFNKASKHNVMPLSKAMDIWVMKDFEYVWDEKYFLPFVDFIKERYNKILQSGAPYGDYDHIEVI